MAMDLSKFQYSKDIDAQALQYTAKNILAKSVAKTFAHSQKSVALDLYNGQLDVNVARQVAMSVSGLEVAQSSNLENAVRFLKNKAALASNLSSEKVEVEKEAKVVSNNPFASASVVNNDYLFIKAA